MTILARLCLILGAAFIGYGIAVATIVPDILSKQDTAFQRFVTAHSAEIDANFSQPTNTPTKQDFYRLKMRVMMSVSPVTSKPASRGRIKTGHSEVLYSYQVS